MSLLERASAWLDGQRQRYLSHPVVYERNGEEIEINAAIGRTEFEQTDDYGVIHKIESRDFLVMTADLVLNGERSLPKAGDRIRQVDGNRAFLCEVMAPGSEPPFRYSDAYRHTLRIHTKHIATEEVL